MVRRQMPDLVYSVSYTTRPPRMGEEPGRDYFFVTLQEFKAGIQAGKWAEWAEVHGHYYGTSAAFIDETLAAGLDVLLDIDVQGARQLVERYPRSVTVFILPPSWDVLKERLSKRGTESGDQIERRLTNAQKELPQQDRYQYRIINDDLDAAVKKLFEIIKNERANRN